MYLQNHLEQNVAKTTSTSTNLEKTLNYVMNSQIPNLSGKWPNGKYCIFANGDCPSGFTRYKS